MAEERTPWVPDVAMSTMSTEVNKTGSWKYIRPEYGDGVAPCNATCPVGIDIEGYLNLLREDRIEEALDLLLLENPMPAITGRVCDHPCEGRCNRRTLDDAVAVHAVERFLGDMALAGRKPKRLPVARSETAAVIGSGPAGLACAYHLARFGYAVTVFESAAEAGGMLRLGIPAYRLPRDVLDRQIEWLEALGIEIRCAAAVGTTIPWSDLETFDSVFIGSGAHGARAMGVDNESADGIWSGLDFLKRVNAGDRPDVGSRVIVVGGGNTAMDCARTALRLGAKPVVLYRRSRAEMPAIADEVNAAEAEGVEFIFLAAPTAVRSDDTGQLLGVECTRMELGEPDESGRRRPTPTDEGRFSMPTDVVLSAIGEVADLAFVTDFLPSVGQSITTSELGGTDDPVVFAGGDVADAPRTVAHALGAGKRAAIGIDRYFRTIAGEPHVPEDIAPLRFADGNLSAARWLHTDPVPRINPNNRVVEPDRINVHHFAPVRRHEDRHDADLHSFDEVNRGLTAQTALDEARRCFNCGVCNECEICLIYCPDVAIVRRPEGRGFYVSLDYCKGCGVCAAECPRGAIAMTREGL